MILWIRRLASMDTLWWSYCAQIQHTRVKSQDVWLHFLRDVWCVYFTSISCWAMLQAAPSPTASGVGTVPERRPLSCPPPFCSGSKRTRGRRRTYNAPTPVHTHIGKPVSMTRGVQQGSKLEPLLFNQHELPLDQILQNNINLKILKFLFHQVTIVPLTLSVRVLNKSMTGSVISVPIMISCYILLARLMRITAEIWVFSWTQCIAIARKLVPTWSQNFNLCKARPSLRSKKESSVVTSVGSF